MISTPILLIMFNRPKHTRIALESIRSQKPKQLFVAQDGPREGRDEYPLLLECRRVVDDLVDWECELHTLYQEKNLGCGRGPYEAMSWFFSQVDYGIILEDDINPHPLFYDYMESVLPRYKDDDRVGMVTAHNLQRQYYGRKSYYFTSAMAGTLGWGTYRRVWEKYDFDIEYDAHLLDNCLKKFYHYPKLSRQKSLKFYEKFMGKDRHDCWDIQFDYFLIVNGYLNARANSCLTSHEGDEDDATHAGYSNPRYKMEVAEPRFVPVTHPAHVSMHPGVRMQIMYKNLKLRVKKIIK